MAFDENFGELPAHLLRLVKNAKVTPAEFDLMRMIGWDDTKIHSHIKANLYGTRYQQPFPLVD